MLKKTLFFTLSMIFSCTVFAKDISDQIKEDLEKYIDPVPEIGMVTDQVACEGITLTDFCFMDGRQFVLVHPNEEVKCQVHYQTHKEDLSKLSVHYFLVGLFPEDAQTYVTKTLGFMNDNDGGSSEFTLKAPEEKGVYQVRFCHGEGLTFEQAKEAWNYGEPGSETVMGIVVVH